MKRLFILIVLSLFLHSLFRQMDWLRVLLLCGAVAAAFGVSKMSSRVIAAVKVPLIVLSLGLSVGLIASPRLAGNPVLAAATVFLAFYSIALAIVTFEDKGRSLWRQAVGLVTLFVSSSINLVATHRTEILLPLCLAAVLFLFITHRTRMIPFVAGYASVMAIFLHFRRVPLFAGGLDIDGTPLFFLLGCAFVLLCITFLRFVTNGDAAGALSFFGLLYVSLDILLTTGFRAGGILMHQPAAAAFIVGPMVGTLLAQRREGA